MTDRKKAVVLLSGGLDSTTALAVAASEGFTTLRAHRSATASATRSSSRARRRVVAQRSASSEHVIVDIDLRAFGGSALTDDDRRAEGPRGEEMAAGIPVTYVPARNTIFLSFALAWAEVLGADDIFIGVNALDYSGYPDCRPEYIEAFERMANLATKAGVEGRMRLHDPHAADRDDEGGDHPDAACELGVDYCAHAQLLRPR